MHVKQVIVVRTTYSDGKGGTFKPRLGKLAAQAAHASTKVFFDRNRHAPQATVIAGEEVELLPTCLDVPLTGAMAHWVYGTFTKIVVGVETEEDLLRIHALAEERGIPTALIQDKGLTEFKARCPSCDGSALECGACGGTGKVGVSTYTAVALGPDDVERIDEVTGTEGLVRVKLL